MKDRSKGVTILSWLIIVLSLINLFGILKGLVTPHSQLMLDQLDKKLTSIPSFIRQYQSIPSVIVPIILLFAGINLLYLKEIGRKILLYFPVFYIFDFILMLFYTRHVDITLLTDFIYVSGVIGIIFWLLIIYFLTRPKVKEQFR